MEKNKQETNENFKQMWMILAYLDRIRMGFAPQDTQFRNESQNNMAARDACRFQSPNGQKQLHPRKYQESWEGKPKILQHWNTVASWQMPTKLKNINFRKLSLLSFYSVQFSSVAQLCPTLCNPMNHSTPGLPVHHQLLEFTQTHVHQVGNVIQPSHPLSSPSPAPSPPGIRVLFQWVNSLQEVTKVLEFQLQHQSFQWTLDLSPLGWTGWISLQSKGLSRVFSNTTVQKHQFFGAQLSSQSNSHIHTWPLEKP